MLDTDCERIGGAFLSQPVNGITSLGFVVAGLMIARRRPDRSEIALLTALVGAGSFLAHGPRPPGAHWLHDVTIAWVLTGIGLEDRRPAVRNGAYVALGVMFFAIPRFNDLVAGAIAVGVIGREVLRRRRRSKAVTRAMGVAAVGALFGNLWRTGSPLCDPDSLVQGHGVWHVLAAVALAIWAQGAPSPTVDPDDRGVIDALDS